MTHRSLEFAAAALLDLTEIAEYVADAAGMAVAGAVVLGIQETTNLLATTPGELGRRRSELGPGIRSFPRPPYVLFFRYTEKRLQVIRILHQRRDIETSYEE